MATRQGRVRQGKTDGGWEVAALRLTTTPKRKDGCRRSKADHGKGGRQATRQAGMHAGK